MSSGTKSLIFILFFISFVWLLGRLLLPFCLPFLVGLGLALAAEPMVGILCGPVHLPRSAGAGIGVSAAFLVLTCLLLSAGALLLQQLRALAGILPELEGAFLSGISLLEDWLLRTAQLAPHGIRPLVQQNIRELFSDGTALLGKTGAWLLDLAGGVLTQIPERALSLFTAILSGFMFSAKLPYLKAWSREHIHEGTLEPLRRLLHRLKATLGRWLLAQVKLTVVTWLILTGGFILLAIPYAPFWALGVSLLDALPVFGTGTALIPWSLICLLEGNRARALGLFSIYLTAALTRTVLEPRLVGRHLGLDPLITLAALYCGYRLWGFGGLILAPMLAVTAQQLLPKAPEKPRFSS